MNTQAALQRFGGEQEQFEEKVRRASIGHVPSVLTDIYEEDVNITVWQRDLDADIHRDVRNLLDSKPGFQLSMTLSPENARSIIVEELGLIGDQALSENIAELVDMFCFLFGLERAGLRITALDRAMCPKFHVDKVPCRLVTTYTGIATEWLPHQHVNRSKLGRGSEGKSDLESGLIKTAGMIQQLKSGDVGLLKGERWEGNEGAGLVHRSPSLSAAQQRLLLTLDFSN